MWKGGLGAAGERGGPQGEGEHAVELDAFQGCKLSFPQRKLLCNEGNSMFADLSTEPPGTAGHCERGPGPSATHHNIALSLTVNPHREI